MRNGFLLGDADPFRNGLALPETFQAIAAAN